MQITEQLIERIARRVFNAMFAPALRQSNVQGGGTPSSVRYAEEAGHAASADTADAVPWTGVSGKPSFATVATSGSYNDLSNKPSIPSVSGSVSGSTMTITINGTAYSLTDTNTWRPVQNTLDSTATGDSLSAYQGYLLARGSARDNSKLPLAGGDMNSGARISFSGGNGYIGNANNAGWLLVQDICSQNGAGDTYWSLRTNGTAHFTDVYANKGVAEDTWASKSDARLKNVLGEVDLTVEQIAAMPAVRFTWKSRAPHQVHVGTLAQGVQKVMPEAVGQTGDGILTVAYGEAAFVSVVKLARRVLELEKLIEHGTHQ
jgi:hypothetical protein